MKNILIIIAAFIFIQGAAEAKSTPSYSPPKKETGTLYGVDSYGKRTYYNNASSSTVYLRDTSNKGPGSTRRNASAQKSNAAAAAAFTINNQVQPKMP